jgi:hypothetical protein
MHLPSAIDLAGSFVRGLGGDIEEYIRLYAISKDRVLKKALGQSWKASGSGYPFSVFTAWQISLSAMEKHTAQFVQLLSFFNRDNINIDVFRRSCETRTRWMPEGHLKQIPPTDTGVPDWFLRTMTAEGGNWDEIKTAEMIKEICSFSFAKFVKISGPTIYQYDQSKLFQMDERRETKLLTIHPLLHEIGRLYLDEQEQIRYSKEAECILWHSIDDDADKPWRVLNQKYFPILYLGGGATRNAVRLVSQLDEVFRHLRPTLRRIFPNNAIPEIGHLQSYYYCFALVYLTRVLGASVESLTSLHLIDCLYIELERLELLRREDMTVQWLRFASRLGPLWIKIFQYSDTNLQSHFELWDSATNCELELYKDSLREVPKALGMTPAGERDRESAMRQNSISNITGTLLHQQIILGPQNLEYGSTILS